MNLYKKFSLTASIMSKKAAEGINALVLEVTYGKGTMRTEKESRDLARIMVGHNLNIQ